MSADPLDDLLEGLHAGDDAAIGRAIEACEPYLRGVVRRRMTPELRSRFDSVDVVQSVWVDVLRNLRTAGCRFEGAVQFRAFLAQAVRNRFIDRIRRGKRSVTYGRRRAEVDPEESPTARGTRPSETLGAEELWARIWASCPPAHRELLTLRRQGLPLAEIAARTGLHEGSVSRILFDLARRLALRCHATH